MVILVGMRAGTRVLVERGDQLAVMANIALESKRAGQLLVVSGEAGHGKTSLIDAFRSRLDHQFAVMYGACDPISVPAPFAPLYECLDSLPRELRSEILEGDRRQKIHSAMHSILDTEPTVLIIEDLQWADEATLDLVRYLGRRLESTRSMLLVSYRPEDVDTTHPLLVVLADLGHRATRVDVPPLSPVGVAELAAGQDVDPELVHRATGGNPFFVDEVLANPDDELPATIDAAVMARVATLPTGSLDLLELVSLSPDGLEIEIAERFSPEAARNIDAAIRRRLLVEDHGRLKCRHDLIRLTVDNSIPPARRRRVHQRLLAEVEAVTPTRRVMSRLAHHAVEAGEVPKAIEYSLQAAAYASKDGSNREARSHYQAALAFRHAMDTSTLDEALVGAAEASCATNHLEEATIAARERVKLAVDEHDLADRLAWSAFIASRWGHVSYAREDAERSLEIHDSLAPCTEAARAKAVLATLAVWDVEWETAADLSSEVLDMAHGLDSDELVARGTLILGKVEGLLGRPGWEDRLRDALDRGMKLGQLETICSGLNSLAFLSGWRGDLHLARERFVDGIDFAASAEMDAWYVAMAASKSGCDLSIGDWETAGSVLERAMAWPTCYSTDCEARTLLATLRCRQGSPAAEALVGAALQTSDQGGTYTEKVMAALLALEAAWLGLYDADGAEIRYNEIRAVGEAASDQHALDRLDLWFRILRRSPSLDRAEDLRAQVDGWRERGFEYESRILETKIDGAPLDEIFRWLEERGATAVVQALRRDLRARGVRGVPSPPRRSTVSNPGGLTTRQLEVLELVAAGLTNAEIATELYISEKTVGHHVSAILNQLSVDNRVQAAAFAAQHGVV